MLKADYKSDVPMEESNKELISSGSESQGEIKQQFEVLYATLCETQKGLIDNTAKVAGFLLLATSWIVTSETARTFMGTDDTSRNILIIAIAGAFVFYAGAALRGFHISQSTFTMLKQLGFIPSKCFKHRKVDTLMIILFITGNLILASLACFLIGTIG